MYLNNPVVNSFLKTDADLLFALKLKAMRRLVEHTSPLEKYAFIERVIDGLPAAVTETDMVTYSMHGDQGLLVTISYTPKRGNGDVHGTNNLEETPRDLFNPSNPRKEVGYKLLSYFLAIRETIQALNKAFKEIKEAGDKVSKRDKYARKTLSHLGWFIYLSISVSDFDLTFHPLAVIHRLLFCKGIAGREHGKHRNKSYWRKTFHDPPKS